MTLSKVYLRKERKPEPGFSKPIRCVAYYRDPEATQLIGRNPWPSRPTRRNKFVMLNCA